MTHLFSLAEVGQRQYSYFFDVLDKELQVIGTIDIVRQGVSVENNINRTIKRQMSGIVLPPTVASDLNPLTDRIRPSMTMPEGTWPLGVYMFAEVHRNPLTGYTIPYRAVDMLDQSMLLDQPVHRAYSFKAGTLISEALGRLLEASPIFQYEIEASGSKIGDEGASWPAGTKLLEIINDICQMGSYYTLYFDNSGVAQVKIVPDLAAIEPELRYGSIEDEQRVFADTIVETDDYLQAPNRYIVVNNSVSESPIVGHWDVPSTAPHSIQQRGFIVATVIDKQGVDSAAEARAAAKAYGQADYSTYQWVSFDAAPDPRHDTFDVVAWEGLNYREQSWHLDLDSDGTHSHELRRIYQEPDFEQ